MLKKFRVKKLLPYFFLFSGLFWLRPSSVLAQGVNKPDITLTAEAGFDGLYKPEFVVPIHISVANNGQPVDGELQIIVNPSSLTDRIVYNAPISLPTQSDKRVTLYVNFTGFVRAIKVDLLDSNKNLIKTTNTNQLSQVSAVDLLYGVASSEPGEFSFLENVTGTRGNAAVSLIDIENLPEVSPAWNALDVLIFNDVDTGELTAEQLKALKGWVSTGGQLVVTGGSGWQKTAFALNEMLPVTISNTETVDNLPALVDRTGLEFRDPGPYLVTNSSLTNGQLIIHQNGLPLLARRDWGRGSVYFLALDPKLAPLLDWDGSDLIWAEVANWVPYLPVWGKGVQNGYAASTAVTSLPILALPSVLQLSIFLSFYVFIVGPANYFFLKRVKRRELAWVTIPSLVLLFSLVAYVVGFRIKGNETIINQMSISFSQVGGDQARVQSLIGLYSPNRSTYDLVFPANSSARPFNRNYGAIAGGGNVEAFTRGNNLIASGVRVDVSDIETFINDSYQPALQLTGRASLILENNTIKLEINIQNNSDNRLENVSLLIGTDIISLGDIPPGENETILYQMNNITSSSPSSSLTSPIYIPGPGSGSPLTFHADIILGTSNYYNDREAYPRWQMLQAFEGDPFPTRVGGGTSYSLPNNVATIIAWSDQPQLEVSLSGRESTSLSTTLYFIELPISQNIINGNNVSIPVSLLNWEVLDQNGPYQTSIQNIFLQGGWVEFEFKPWPEFQSMKLSNLEIVLEPQDGFSSQTNPEIRLWNWQQEIWDTLEEGKWGTTNVTNYKSYIGTGNAVRVRLQDKENFGSQIKQIYPILTGDLQ